MQKTDRKLMVERPATWARSIICLTHRFDMTSHFTLHYIKNYL